MIKKIIVLVACLSASVFAFAEAQAPANEKAPAAKNATPKMVKKFKAFRDQHMQCMMFTLSDAELDALAKNVADVRAMNANERQEALKKLPRPQRALKAQSGKGPRQGKKAMGPGKGPYHGKKGMAPGNGPRQGKKFMNRGNRKGMRNNCCCTPNRCPYGAQASQAAE